MAEEKQRVLFNPTFHGSVKADYPFWKVRVMHHLKQEGLSHCLERIPAEESYAERPQGAKPEDEAEKKRGVGKAAQAG